MENACEGLAGEQIKRRKQPCNMIILLPISPYILSNQTIFQQTNKNQDINASLYFQKQINTDYGPCTFPTR
jgi:hypothetical protein